MLICEMWGEEHHAHMNCQGYSKLNLTVQFTPSLTIGSKCLNSPFSPLPITLLNRKLHLRTTDASAMTVALLTKSSRAKNIGRRTGLRGILKCRRISLLHPVNDTICYAVYTRALSVRSRKVIWRGCYRCSCGVSLACLSMGRGDKELAI